MHMHAYIVLMEEDLFVYQMRTSFFYSIVETDKYVDILPSITYLAF